VTEAKMHLRWQWQVATVGVSVWWSSNQSMYGRVVAMAVATIEATRGDKNEGQEAEC